MPFNTIYVRNWLIRVVVCFNTLREYHLVFKDILVNFINNSKRDK